jgi:CBS domain-containing protein
MNLKEEIRNFVRKDAPSVTPETTLKETLERMVEKEFTAALVREGDQILGIVTDTDIIANVASGRDMREVKAKEFMSSCELLGTNPCLQLCEDESIENAMKVMAVGNIHHLLVWDTEGRPLGILSSGDLIKALKE